MRAIRGKDAMGSDKEIRGRLVGKMKEGEVAEVIGGEVRENEERGSMGSERNEGG